MSVIIEGLNVTFGARVLFEHLTERFEPGEMVAIVGPSGSGKSTLLGVIAGFVTPTSGAVTVDSGPETVDWIFQSTHLLSRRTARDNVALGAMSRGLDFQSARLVGAETLERINLDHLADQPAFRLSGGERQRIAVARSIARRARVMLADEPTASLDPSSRNTICSALRVAASTGAAVLIATHDPHVASICDRAVVLG